MSLEWSNFQLHEQWDDGSIEGYVTNTKESEQTKNYLNKQGIRESLPLLQQNYTTIAILKSLWVEEEERNNGIGSALLTNFIENAQTKNAEAIILVADISETNEFDLITWYEGYGFEILFENDNSFPLMIKKLR